MQGTTWRAILLAGVAAAALSAPAAATRVRPGTISFGGQGSWAFLGGNTFLGRSFTSGPGGELRVRYRLRHGRVFGATFGETFYRTATPPPFVKVGSDSTEETLDQLAVITAGVEFGQYFGPHEHPAYVLLGIGLWNPTARDVDGELFEGNKNDHIYISGTFGTEIFVRRTVALDLSARARLHLGQEQGYPYPVENSSPRRVEPEIQLGAGIHFYVLD